jgi:two-component system, NtrC family, response regulator HydG
MFTSFSEFKYFQSFRVPVEGRDNIRFSVEFENEQGKMEYIQDGDLMDVSLTGLGFKTMEHISCGKNLRFSINFKRLRFDINATVVRAFSAGVDSEEIIYGTELDNDDVPQMKRFVQQYVSSFSQDRSKDCLLNLAMTERYASATEGFEMFSLLLSLFKDITQFGNMEGFAESMLEEIVRLLNAQRASIFLINPDTNELEAVAALGIDKDLLRFDYRKGIAGSVFTTGVALNIDTINDKIRFSEEMDNMTGYRTKSVICYPVSNREDKVIGVIQVLNKRNQNRFTAEDEKTMKVLGLICSSVFHNYNPISEKSLIRRFSTPHDRAFALIGRSPHVNDVRKAIVKLKDIDSSLYITGELGVGKSLIAQIIHNEGKRGLSSFQTVECKGVTPKDLYKDIFGEGEHVGKLEKCAGGTVEFRNVDLMPLDMQNTLVRALKDRWIPTSESRITLDVRSIFTSTKDLHKLTHDENSFNIELFDFLAVSKLCIEPLRKRKQDVEDLMSYFLKKECKKEGFLLKNFSAKAIDAFKDYNWPGNVYELQNSVNKAVSYNPKNHIIDKLDNGITPILDIDNQRIGFLGEVEHASDYCLPLKERVLLVEREMIFAEIKRHKGNKSRAAKSMGISREALRKKLIQSTDVLGKLEVIEPVKKVA